MTAGEKAQVASRETKSVAAYDAFLMGWEHYGRRTPGDFAKAVRYFEWAVEHARYMTLETIAPVSENVVIKLPPTAA